MSQDENDRWVRALQRRDLTENQKFLLEQHGKIDPPAIPEGMPEEDMDFGGMWGMDFSHVTQIVVEHINGLRQEVRDLKELTQRQAEQLERYQSYQSTWKGK